MHDRLLLGPADVSDGQLHAMVADQLGAPPADVDLLDSRAEPVDYDLPAITTAGRWWVRGRATVRGRDATYAFFVKHVQSWRRHPFFAFVPTEHREAAAAAVPWRTEPQVYRSGLADRLPAGLAMPRAFAVHDLDEESACVWLERVPEQRTAWSERRYRRAARLLGRLAGSARVRGLPGVEPLERPLRAYLEGRLRLQVLPALFSSDLWTHPLVSGAYDAGLRGRLLRAAERVDACVDELEAAPRLAAHGDASPNNLLPDVADDGFVLIDYGFWGAQPVGFDLGQLVVGDVQIGRRPARLLRATDDLCRAAYVEGLRDEAVGIAEPVVARAHALQLLVFTGLSSPPLELLDAEPTPELHALAAERAALTRFSLDLVAATGG